MIMFGARSMGFGRGFDEIDVEVYDEAQILDTKALEDMVAATNQARHEHGALLFFMGTPPRPSDPSGAFTERRARRGRGSRRTRSGSRSAPIRRRTRTTGRSGRHEPVVPEADADRVDAAAAEEPQGRGFVEP
jgi:hypothetical protein